MAARTRPLPRARTPFPATMRDPLLVAGTLLLTVAVYAATVGNRLIALSDPVDPKVTDLTSLSFVVNGGSAAAYHATNLLLHLGNVALVYLVVRSLTSRAFLAHFCALAFAVHPVNVDAVAWVAARSGLLATVFVLGSVLAYLRRRDRLWMLGVSVLLGALGALASWSALGLPLLLILVDYYQARRFDGLSKLPYLVAPVAAAIFVLPSFTPAGFLAVCAALVNLLLKLVVPVHLAMAYAPATGWYAYAAPVVLLLLIAAAVRFGGRVGVFGAGVFLVVAVPGALAESGTRFGYLAGVGIFLIAGHFVALLLERRPDIRVQAITSGLLAGVLLVFSVVSLLRGLTWHDTVRITTASLEVDSGVASVHAARGAALFEARDYASASRDFAQAVALDPSYALGHVYIGRIKAAEKDFSGAVDEYDKAIALDSRLAVAYAERGKARTAQSDSVGALSDFSWAIGLDAGLVEAYHQRGILEIQVGSEKAAVSDFDKVIALMPGNADAYYYRGIAQGKLNDMAAACADLHRAEGLGQAKAKETLAKSCNKTS